VSRYYTNVQIPDRFDNVTSLIEQVELLKFEKSRLEKKIEYLHSILENIPMAIDEYGYVDVSYDKNKHMRIAKIKEEKNK
jgi:hypothetical protein